MIVLAVHTSSPTLGLAVARDGTLIGETVVLSRHEHLEHTVPAIRELLSALGIHIRAVDGFGVSLGPGSFSGVRVGLAAVKGMALALGRPAAGLCSLELAAYDALQPGETGLVFMDAKRDQVFFASYCRTGDQLVNVEPPTIASLKDVPRTIAMAQHQVVVWADKTAPPPDPIADAPYRIPTRPPALICALLAHNRLARGLHDNLHALKPIYVRRPDAEERPTLLRANS